MNIERGINIIIKVLTLHFQRIREVDQLLVKNSINYSGGHLTRVNASSRYGRHDVNIEIRSDLFGSLLRSEKTPLHKNKEAARIRWNKYVLRKSIYIILHKFWFLRPRNEDEHNKYNNYFLIHIHVCN